MNIPTELVSGDSITWLDSATTNNLGESIDSSSWTLVYAIKGAANLSITSTNSGSGWSTTISAAQSATLSPGNYAWHAYATSGSNRVTLGQGTLIIKTNIAAIGSTGFDGRSQIKQDLDAVREAIRSIVKGGAVQQYTIGNRSLTKMKMSELIELESKLKVDLVREEKAAKIAQGLGDPKNLFVRFKK